LLLVDAVGGWTRWTRNDPGGLQLGRDSLTA
jgi:hypothetical protein